MPKSVKPEVGGGKTIPQAIKDLDLDYLSPFFIDDLLASGKITEADVQNLISIYGSLSFWVDLASSSKGPLLDVFVRHPNVNADYAQLALYRTIEKYNFDSLIYVLTKNASDLNVTSNTTLTSGVNIFKSLNINSGVTLTLGAGPGIIIADTVNNAGNIVSGWVKGVGGNPGRPPGRGGDGAGGIIIFSKNITTGTISADGKNGEDGGSYVSSGGAQGGGAGLFWLIGSDMPGKGGNGGGASTGGIGNYNGGGGGNAGNNGGGGGDSTRISFSLWKDLLFELLKSITDWWLINIVGKTPLLYRNVPYLGGSGGGGGGDYTYSSGGGGGGGGEIVVIGLNITAGTISAKGGNGGVSSGYGGGGGGGGVVYVFYRNLSGSFSFNVAGGAGGADSGASGTAGVAKTIPLHY